MRGAGYCSHALVAIAVQSILTGCYVYEPTVYDKIPIEIKVEGTTGIPFSGTISEIRYKVSQSGVTPISTTKKVEGTVPTTYFVDVKEGLRAVSCTMQKDLDAA